MFPFSLTFCESVHFSVGCWSFHISVLELFIIYLKNYLFVFDQLPSHVQLIVTPWTAACQASLFITNSQSSLKLMSIELVMPSNHLMLCHPFSSCPQSFPASGSFQMSQFFASGGQSIGVSASASVFPMNIKTDFL